MRRLSDCCAGRADGRMSGQARSVVVGVAALAVWSIGAAPASADMATTALAGFQTACLDNGADFDKTASTAALLGWIPIPASKLAIMGPKQTPEAALGWSTRAPDFPSNTTIGVTRGHYNGKLVQTCSMFVVDVDGRAFEAALVDQLKARKTFHDSDGTHETRAYDLKTASDRLVLIVTLPVDPSVMTFSVGAVSEAH